MTTKEVFVVLGLDTDGKPRASKFYKAYEATARKIARLQNFKLGYPKDAHGIDAAERLVDGKTFHAGKGLVPLVSPAIYESLLNVLNIEDVPADNKPAAKTSPVTAPTTTNPWNKIAVGSKVLCPDGMGKERSWWEATVSAISKDRNTLTVHWTHHPLLKPFAIKRKGVAIPPGNE